MWVQSSWPRKTDIEASDGPPPDHAKKPAVKKRTPIFTKTHSALKNSNKSRQKSISLKTKNHKASGNFHLITVGEFVSYFRFFGLIQIHKYGGCSNSILTFSNLFWSFFCRRNIKSIQLTFVKSSITWLYFFLVKDATK